MAEARTEFHDLVDGYRQNQVDRRTFLRRAGALGISAATLGTIVGAEAAAAQDATPAAQAAGGEFQPLPPISREEFKQQLFEAFPLPEDPQPGGTLIVGDLSRISTTNYLVSGDSPTNPTLNLMQETLYNSNPIDGSYVPGLADTFSLADDGVTWTFNLHPGISWHDGQPFTSADVILSMDAQSSSDTGSSYTGSFTNTVASYEAPDENTVVVTAVDVFSVLGFLGNAYVPIVPAHIWGDVPFAEWVSDPGSTGADPSRVIGTGPFRFQEFNAGELTLVRNDDYWDDVPYIETYIHQVWPDSTSAVEALRAGDIDIYENVEAADVESLQDPEGDTDVALYDTFSFSWFGYNLDPEKTTLFQQREVRQALFYALDRQSMVDNILLGYGEVAQGTQPILSIAYDPEGIKTKYDYDPERANQLLDDAGWVAGDDGIRVRDGQRLAFETMYGAGSAASDQLVAALQQYWAEVGVEMTPNPVDFSAVLVPTITATYDYQMCLLGFNWDVTGDQSAMFSSDAYGDGFNAMRYSNPEVDRLNAEANREQDEERRIQLLKDSANLVNEDLPVGILWFRKDRTGYRTRVQNYNPNAYGGYLWSIQYVALSEQ